MTTGRKSRAFISAASCVSARMEALSLADEHLRRRAGRAAARLLAAASSSAPPASSAAAVPTEVYNSCSTCPPSVLSDPRARMACVPPTWRVEAASARLRNLVARAVPIAVRDTCEILLPLPRRSGERWPAVLGAPSSSPPRATWARASRPDTNTPCIFDGWHHCSSVSRSPLVMSPEGDCGQPRPFAAVRAVACGGEHGAAARER